MEIFFALWMFKNVYCHYSQMTFWLDIKLLDWPFFLEDFIDTNLLLSFSIDRALQKAEASQYIATIFFFLSSVSLPGHVL